MTSKVSLELAQEIFEEENCPRITIVGGAQFWESETFSYLTFGKAFKTKTSKTSRLLSRLANLFPRKNAIAYGSKEQELGFPIKAGIDNTPLLVKKDINRNLFRIPCGERPRTFVCIGGIQIMVIGHFRSGINSPMKFALRDNIRNGSRVVTLGLIQGNLYRMGLVFTMYPKYVVPLEDWDVDGTLSLAHEFVEHNLLKEGSSPYSIKYKVVYALTNSPRHDLFRDNEFFEL